MTFKPDLADSQRSVMTQVKELLHARHNNRQVGRDGASTQPAHSDMQDYEATSRRSRPTVTSIRQQ